MAKTYLNNDDKDWIANKIVGRKYDKLKAQHETKGELLAWKIYDEVYPENLREAMQALGPGAFYLKDKIDGRLEGEYIMMPKFENPRPVFEKHRAYFLEGPADTPTLVSILAWNRRTKELLDERQDMRLKVKSTLNGFRYIDDAAAAWPEAEVFIKERWQFKGADASYPVPSVRLQDLNRALDLPPV